LNTIATYGLIPYGSSERESWLDFVRTFALFVSGVWEATPDTYLSLSLSFERRSDQKKEARRPVLYITDPESCLSHHYLSHILHAAHPGSQEPGIFPELVAKLVRRGSRVSF
jgi:hypothetical protein